MHVDPRPPRRLVGRAPARALGEVVAREEGLVVRVVVQGADLRLGGREGDGLDVVCFNKRQEIFMWIIIKCQQNMDYSLSISALFVVL